MHNFDETSHLVSNMRYEVNRMGQYPVLIGDEIAYFHDIDGGYDSQTGEDVVHFIHEVQSEGSPNHLDPEQAAHEMEAHLDENYYNLDVTSVRTENEYPDRDYVLSVRVQDYRFGPQSFSDALSVDIDKRETRYE
jgi:hypothetical protein